MKDLFIKIETGRGSFLLNSHPHTLNVIQGVESIDRIEFYLESVLAELESVHG